MVLPISWFLIFLIRWKWHITLRENKLAVIIRISEYRLRAFITHMGTSATVGHYVCHINQDGQWIIFNDSKVALSVNPPKELAYLYLYERVSG